MALSTLVVDGAALKRALGITDDSEDALLSQLEADAVAYVEGETHRRFQSPETRVEDLDGSGARTLYLAGHIDDEDGTVAVRERCGRGAWTMLVAGTDYERRRDTLVRLDGFVWSPATDYELTYDDGYGEAPADIQALVIELVSVARSRKTLAEHVMSGASGLTSETLGEFSQTFSTVAVTAAAKEASALGAVGLATLNRWTRRRV